MIYNPDLKVKPGTRIVFGMKRPPDLNKKSKNPERKPDEISDFLKPGGQLDQEVKEQFSSHTGDGQME